MLACARRASVILFVLVSALALAAPATDAEPRVDSNRQLPASYITSPVTGTDLVLSPRHKTIKYGHAVRLVSRLTSKFGPVRGETVTWWTRRSHGKWHRLAAAKTNNDGRTAMKRHLAHTTQWQVRYGGDLLQDRTRSAITTVTVLPPSSPSTDGFAQRVLQEAARHKG